MSATLNSIIIIFLIVIGSFLLFISIFGAEFFKSMKREKLELLRRKFMTAWLTAGVILLLAAFSLIVFGGDKSGNEWTKEEKEAMAKKIMESSIFVHGTAADTAKLVSECFIEKYTGIYTPKQMKEQNKMSNEELSKITSIIMIECLKKYGLPRIDTTMTDHRLKDNPATQTHL
jgi:hypothetical protein